MKTRHTVGVLVSLVVLFAAVSVGVTAQPPSKSTEPVPVLQQTERSIEALQPDDWIDKLIVFLEILCQIIGPEYCDSTESGTCDQIADAHLTAFIDEYNANGLPALSAADSAEASDTITDILDLLDAPDCGSFSVIGDAITAFESAYDDLN